MKIITDTVFQFCVFVVALQLAIIAVESIWTGVLGDPLKVDVLKIDWSHDGLPAPDTYKSFRDRSSE